MTAKKHIVLDEAPKVELDNYSIHKQLFAQMPEPEEKVIKKKLASAGGWFSSHPDCNYYMIICREISYYTVMHFNNMNYEKGMQELKEILESRGTILDIVYNHAEDAYECWVKNFDGEVEMYYLFTYDWGVVEIN